MSKCPIRKFFHDISPLPRALPILCQPATVPEPCKHAFDDPTTGLLFEAFGFIGALNDLQGPFPDLVQRAPEFWSCITTIGEDMAQPRERMTDRIEHDGRAVPVLNVRAVNGQTDEQSGRIDDDVAFTDPC
ncbi:hypothetical protein EDD55_102409 [Varunaivibrio sulfuroxidans]|uniref:Uncharacterized protein n=1 Tax=Varunaivibrio sulfuroxidans TaxID=1773489 RepID=A0A4R3JEW3_9PROT|nr:hypothetical protein EDD55_102409 [Varunaivibrio sulfuroxidans]